MVRRKRVIIILVLCAVLIIGLGAVRINTRTPIGAFAMNAYCMDISFLLSFYKQRKSIRILMERSGFIK